MANIFQTLYKRVPMLSHGFELNFYGGDLPDDVLAAEPVSALDFLREEFDFALANPKLAETVNGNLVFRLGGLYNAFVDNQVQCRKLGGEYYFPVNGGYLSSAKYEIDRNDDEPADEVIVAASELEAALSVALPDGGERAPIDPNKIELVFRLTADFVKNAGAILIDPATGKLVFPKLWDFAKIGALISLVTNLVKDFIAVFRG